MSHYQKRERSNGSFNGFRSLRFNTFLQTIAQIAQSEGENPHRIIPMFRSLSSAHFLCGPPTLSNEQLQTMPWGIWQKVCGQFSAAMQSPYYRLGVDSKSVAFKEKSDVFIASKTTEQFVQSGFLLEQFDSPRRLYQYLNWTLRISKVAQTVALLEGRGGGRLLVINVELHDRNGNELFALCPPNDVTTHRAQNWQLAALLSANEVHALLGVPPHFLPPGVRSVCPQYAAYRQLSATKSLREIKARIRCIDGGRKPIRYSHLKCIQTGNGKRKECPEEEVLTIGLTTFYRAVRRALKQDDIELIPIVSIVSRKNRDRRQKHEDFSVDYLLPVQVGNVWVGIAYRNNECSMALLDRYDIVNKAILCCPQFDCQSLKWFHNGFNRFRVVPDGFIGINSALTSSVSDKLTLTPTLSTTLSSSISWGSSVGSTESSDSDHSDLYLSPITMTSAVCPLTPPPMMTLDVPVSTVQDLVPLLYSMEAHRVYFEQILVKNKQFLNGI